MLTHPEARRPAGDVAGEGRNVRALQRKTHAERLLIGVKLIDLVEAEHASPDVDDVGGRHDDEAILATAISVRQQLQSRAQHRLMCCSTSTLIQQ